MVEHNTSIQFQYDVLLACGIVASSCNDVAEICAKIIGRVLTIPFMYTSNWIQSRILYITTTKMRWRSMFGAQHYVILLGMNPIIDTICSADNIMNTLMFEELETQGLVRRFSLVMLRILSWFRCFMNFHFDGLVQNKDLTPLLTNWNYVFLALTHRLFSEASLPSGMRRIDRTLTEDLNKINNKQTITNIQPCPYF